MINKINEQWKMSLINWIRYTNKEIQPITWMGTKLYKNPLDLWIVQEIINEVKPDYFVEIGTGLGGSALYYAHLFDILHKGIVITIDTHQKSFNTNHYRIHFIQGNSSSQEVIDEVHRICKNKITIVNHDADHHKDAVLRDLNAYCDLVSLGSYLIVEDGFVDIFNYQWPEKDNWDGPLSAIEEFLKSHPEFNISKKWQKFIATYNPCGYLERKSQDF